MPKHYKAHLNHVGFDWREWSKIFHDDLDLVQEKICESLRFYDEHGVIGEHCGSFDDNIDLERKRLILEIAGVLSKAAAIVVDGGYASTNQSIATLKSIKKNPSLIKEQLLEIDPGALAKLASQYQRADETPGTYSLDILAAAVDPGQITAPTASSVRDAALRAIKQGKKGAQPGRPENPVNKSLAEGLGSIFVRYNNYVGRSSIIGFDPEAKQIETGRFAEFIKIVIPPLSRFLHAVNQPAISVEKVARESAKIYGNPAERKSAG
jgi:hypothetical protein